MALRQEAEMSPQIILRLNKKSFIPPHTHTNRMACGILIPLTGIEPETPSLEAWSLNHWTAREVPYSDFLNLARQKLLTDTVWVKIKKRV